METAGGGVNASGCGECRKADGDAKAADGDNGGTGALKNGKDDCGPVQEFWVEGHEGSFQSIVFSSQFLVRKGKRIWFGRIVRETILDRRRREEEA